jgi:purine-nucleoside phosphorylase
MRAAIQPSRSQVEAYFFGSPQRIGKKILFIKREERLSEYAAYLTDVEMFGNVWRGFTGKLHGELVSVIAAGVGPSAIGDAVYALYRPGAACLYSGTCGGLHETLEIGDTFVADQAVCGDGYSLHFGYPPFSIAQGDPGIVQAIQAALAASAERFDSGLAFTTGSVVRETDPDFWQAVDKRCRIIEMGAAAFFAAAEASDKRAAAYFWVTDLPTRGMSFFDQLPVADAQAKEDRYCRVVSLDLTLLSCL